MRSPTWARQDGELWGSCPGHSGAGWLSPGGGEGREVSAVHPHPRLLHPVSGRRWRTLGACGQVQASPARPASTHAARRACPGSLACPLPSSLPPLGAALLIPLVFARRWPPDSDGVRGSDCHPFPGRAGQAALPPRDGHALWSSQKGGALTAPSLSGCVSAPRGRRFRRNALPGGAAASAARAPQRDRSPRRQAAPHAHQGTYRSPADCPSSPRPPGPAATLLQCGASCPGWGCVFPLVGPSRGHRGNVGAPLVLCKDAGGHSHSHRVPSGVPGSGLGSPGRLSRGRVLSRPLRVTR